MNRCLNCVLPESFPGIHFDKNGLCHYCLKFKRSENLEEKKKKYREKFERLIEKYRGKSFYDAIMSYSGGKDSTYTLSLIKEKYGLNVLAVTLDNGFLPKQTEENIQSVTEKLNVDLLTFKPRFDILKKIFIEGSKRNIYSPSVLSRASSICTSCIALVKFNSLRMALEKNIPFIVYGWSPGQIPLTSSILKNNSQMIRSMQMAVFEPLYELVGESIRPYFLEKSHFRASRFFPYNLSPLAFFNYNGKKILEEVSKLGWKVPKDVDVHSSNCLLNTFANSVHKERYGYHPYVYELAKLVREGYLKRSAALQKINQPENFATIELVKKKLGF